MDFIPLMKYFQETQSASFITFILRSFLTCEDFNQILMLESSELSLSSPRLQQARTWLAGWLAENKQIYEMIITTNKNK